MSLFKPKRTNWDKINGLRDLAGEKDTLQRYKTPWIVGGNIGNPSRVEPFIWTDLPPLESASGQVRRKPTFCLETEL